MDRNAIGIMLSIIFGMAFIAMISTLGCKTNSGNHTNNYFIDVTGTKDLKFSGSCSVMSGSGIPQKDTLNGKVPTQYSYIGDKISCSFQKHEDSGELKISIKKNGKKFNSSSTSADHGEVSLTAD